jgi:hypothetical protein
MEKCKYRIVSNGYNYRVEYSYLESRRTGFLWLREKKIEKWHMLFPVFDTEQAATNFIEALKKQDLAQLTPYEVVKEL